MDEFDIFYRSRLDYWKKQNLSYGWYWFLAVFFGWLGLDQLYLGSPAAGVGKAILNMTMLGWPWLYDALNATLNREHIQMTGPINPLFGNIGVGAGRFVGDGGNVPESHKNMLIYGLVLIFFGIFGADSFLVGDKLSGYMRLIMLFTFFFTPIAIIWWLYKLYLYFIRTDQLLDQNYVYFGAPKPTDPSLICPNVLEQITVWFVETLAAVIEYIPVVNNFVPLIRSLAESLKVAYGIAKETVGTAINTAETIATAGESMESALNTDKIKEAINTERIANSANSAKHVGGGARGRGRGGARGGGGGGGGTRGGGSGGSGGSGGEDKEESPVTIFAIITVVLVIICYISTKFFAESKKLITGIVRKFMIKNNTEKGQKEIGQNEQRNGQTYPDDSP